MFRTLELYMMSGEHRIFNKYEINEDSVIINKKTKKYVTKINRSNYYTVTLYGDDGKKNNISVARAMLSTFIGRPEEPMFTADHINPDDTLNDNIDNLRYADAKMQRSNQSRTCVNRDGMIVVHDGCEMTVGEWAEKENVDRSTIKRRARKNNGWTYKSYADINGEIWKKVEYSSSSKGFWMVSNIGRASYHTKYARRVYFPYQLGRSKGYPHIGIGGKHSFLHIIVFKTFKPNEYYENIDETFILHNNDDKLDCNILNLRIGNRSMNALDSHRNGCYEGKKNERCKCAASCGDKQYEFQSISEALIWLRENGYPKAVHNGIYQCLQGNLQKSYGHYWKIIE
jgi:hypothetical protein